ncbi:hypothetical protein [Nocardia alni]|uniref:hypothetical protein n=1 Tax=Nocardia alni TaxID=2815723 RepID=UPI001C22E1AB|nr:hypothetical protein [Nocardia alni]
MVTDRRARRAVFKTSSALLLGIAALSAPIALAPAADAAAGTVSVVTAGSINHAPGAVFNYYMTCYAADTVYSLDVKVSHPADGSVGAVTITDQYITCDGTPHAVPITVNSNKGGAWKVGDQVNIVMTQLDTTGRPMPDGTTNEKTTLQQPNY